MISNEFYFTVVSLCANNFMSMHLNPNCTVLGKHLWPSLDLVSSVVLAEPGVVLFTLPNHVC